MKIRDWKRETDYPLAVSWWKAHGKEPEYIPAVEFLPRSGFVVESDEGEPLLMGWLYCYMDVPAAQIGYVAGNPANRPRQSAEAFDLFCDHLATVADRIGVRLTARFTNLGIIKRLARRGFFEIANGVTELVRLAEIAEVQHG